MNKIYKTECRHKKIDECELIYRGNSNMCVYLDKDYDDWCWHMMDDVFVVSEEISKRIINKK